MTDIYLYEKFMGWCEQNLMILRDVSTGNLTCVDVATKYLVTFIITTNTRTLWTLRISEI